MYSIVIDFIYDRVSLYFLTYVSRVFVMSARLEKFWRISLYATDDAIATLCDGKFSQIEGFGRKFRPIDLSNRVIS